MKIKRIVAPVLLVAAVVLSACGDQQAPDTESRPNIVFVLLDDVRYDDIIDHPFIELPNIQRLANEGASFRQFFTSAPLCSPSRAVFMTGQYPHRNGIVDNGERAEQSHRIVTFPKLLQDSGYRTGFFGKWHMGHADDSPRPGFDRWVSFVGQGVYLDPEMNIDGVTSHASGYMTDILTDHAVSFIDEADETPFLAFIAHKASHPEIHPNYVRTFPPAAGDENLYTGEPLNRSPSWQASTAGKPALERPVDYSDPRSPEGGLPDDIILNRLRMLSAVDRGLGRLIDILETKQLLDDTVFVVTSDQGFFYGEFGLAQERRLAYEPSIHIPLIIRYPEKVSAGTHPDALVSNVDIAPTMMALGGAKIPDDLDGYSMAPLLDGSALQIREDFLIEYYSDEVFPRIQNMGYQALRTGRYKYIRYSELKDMDELYDLESDPYELDNLLPNRAPSGLAEQLAARINAQDRGASLQNKPIHHQVSNSPSN
ncbi:MAG: arylsulfatase A-like enzyme [Glaciecola sp.]|jgi:arylsulfatase A-like enzyme|uniref:sulfatase-like hydrolase/transferase n=1 Tax=Congregibacter sp. TaxID=2744308 RepID=UPI0039E22467